MNSAAFHSEPEALPVRLASRGHLTAFLMELAAEIRADSYMLFAMLHDGDRTRARIVASNWIHDAVELAGCELIAALAQGPLACAPGMPPRAIRMADAPDLKGPVGGEEARLLSVLGHSEIYPLRLDVGRQRCFLLFSAAETGAIDAARLPGAQLRCCYALSQMPSLIASEAAGDPLSDRERECLFWVSEGKTTDEVALILGVSANTVNSYVTSSIRKLSASNRAMAVATAIRSGIL